MGNEVLFVCRQDGRLTSWDIVLPDIKLTGTVQATTVERVDVGAGFHILVTNRSNGSILSELQVTARTELDGVTVICIGASGNFMSTIQISSIGKLV